MIIIINLLSEVKHYKFSRVFRTEPVLKYTQRLRFIVHINRRNECILYDIASSHSRMYIVFFAYSVANKINKNNKHVIQSESNAVGGRRCFFVCCANIRRRT